MTRGLFRFGAIMMCIATYLILETATNAGAATALGGFYSPWQEALSKYVDNQGTVNYKDWKEDRTGLDSFVQHLGAVKPKEYEQMSRAEKLALWLNTYNALTIKLVLDHYPVHRTGFNFYPDNSIRQIKGIWDRYKFRVAGRVVSLHDIENKILLSEFKQPLIHFAINCASRSCPRLLNKPYNAGRLRNQLEQSAAMFVSDASRNKIDVQRKKVEISMIFDWFGADFIPHYLPEKRLPNRSDAEAAVINFLVQHTSGARRKILQSNQFKLSYLPYDWSLNDQGKNK